MPPRGHNRARLLTHEGETLSIVEWAERFNIPYNRLRRRLQKGWPLERALTENASEARSVAGKATADAVAARRPPKEPKVRTRPERVRPPKPPKPVNRLRLIKALARIRQKEHGRPT